MKKTFKFLLLAIFVCAMMPLSHCKKQYTSKLPGMVLDSINIWSLTSVDVYAHVTQIGATKITSIGFCYSTKPGPTTNDPNTAGQGQPGYFMSALPNLAKNTTYYVRAYATSAQGTIYSNEMSFNGGGTIQDNEGNLYRVVTINKQTWMAENLRVTHYNNGDPIPLANSATEWQNQTEKGAYCYVNNSAANTDDFGLLYSGYAAFDSRGICPEGYSVVENREGDGWYGLIGSHSVNTGMLKDSSTSYWNSPNYEASNSLEFSARGSGYRDHEGNYLKFKDMSYFWLRESERLFYFAYATYIQGDDNSYKVYSGHYPRKSGFCVRCMKMK